jgi:hypothetical protein
LLFKARQAIADQWEEDATARKTLLDYVDLLTAKKAEMVQDYIDTRTPKGEDQKIFAKFYDLLRDLNHNL